MTDTLLDLNKPVQTRKGMAVRIICTDLKGDRPIIYAIDNGAYEYVHNCDKYGKQFFPIEDEFDLVNVPDEKQVYYNVWKHPGGELFLVHSEQSTVEGANKSRKYFEQYGGGEIVGRVKLTLKEGQWDE